MDPYPRVKNLVSVFVFSCYNWVWTVCNIFMIKILFVSMASIGSGTPDLDLCFGIHISELLACIRSKVPYLLVFAVQWNFLKRFQRTYRFQQHIGFSSFRASQMWIFFTGKYEGSVAQTDDLCTNSTLNIRSSYPYVETSQPTSVEQLRILNIYFIPRIQMYLNCRTFEAPRKYTSLIF